MPTWQSRKKIAKNAMKFIIFWIAALLTAARNDDTGIHATILSRFQALLHGLNFRCHSRAGGNLENIIISRPEFISGSTTRDAETSSA